MQKSIPNVKLVCMFVFLYLCFIWKLWWVSICTKWTKKSGLLACNPFTYLFLDGFQVLFWTGLNYLLGMSKTDHFGWVLLKDSQRFPMLCSAKNLGYWLVSLTYVDFIVWNRAVSKSENQQGSLCNNLTPGGCKP